MTNLEAVGAVVGFTPPDTNIMLKPLLDVGLSATDAYTPANGAKVDIAAIGVLTALKLLAKIDEGGFGVTFDTAQANKTISFLYTKSGAGSGLPNPLAAENGIISNGSYNW